MTDRVSSGALRCASFAFVGLLLTGCPPDLSRYDVVAVGQDGGTPPGVDAGRGTPNPIDLGTPCPNPHLLVGAVEGSSGATRVWRLDGSGNLCRNSELVSTQRAFSSAIRTVHWHPEVGEILGLSGAVIALDAEGFPAWRYQPASSSGFEPAAVTAFGSGSALRIAVSLTRGSSTLSAMILIDGRGFPTSAEIRPPFFARAIAAHPDGTARVVIGASNGPNLDVFSVTDATTRIPDDGAPLFTTTATDLPATFGSREHLASDVMTGRLVITHEDGIAHWKIGRPPPTTAFACTNLCSSFIAAAPDPNDEEGAYAVCSPASGSRPHLVRVDRSGCSIVIDGSSIGGRSLTDVTLVRAAL